MSNRSIHGFTEYREIGCQHTSVPHLNPGCFFPPQNLERGMPKTLAFGVGQIESRFNFEKCLSDGGVWDQGSLVFVGPSHFENGDANFPWDVARIGGSNQSVNKWAHIRDVAFKVARNAFSVGFEPARYSVFETGPGLVMGETEFPEFAIDPNGEGQLNQSSMVDWLMPARAASQVVPSAASMALTEFESATCLWTECERSTVIPESDGFSPHSKATKRDVGSPVFMEFDM